jgi:hypothetical protein
MNELIAVLPSLRRNFFIFFIRIHNATSLKVTGTIQHGIQQTLTDIPGSHTKTFLVVT